MSELNGQTLTLVPLSAQAIAKANAAEKNTKFAGGIKEGGDFLPTLGLRGRQFRIKTGRQEVSLDNRTLDVILVTARASLSKQYYAGKYETGTVKKPDCQSVNGVRPDPGVPTPMSDNCATCRMNAWGSKKNEVTGKDGKACADMKLLILAPPTLDGDKPLQLQLPAASLKNLAQYIKLLTHNGLEANQVVTQLVFTDDAFPKLEFKYVRNLKQDEAEKVLEIERRDDVQATLGTPAAPTEEAPAQHASEPPTVVANVQPAPPAQTAPTGPAPEPDHPGDDVANILSQWGVK